MTKRDHAKMICDAGELSGIFKDATSLEAFLQEIAEMVSQHMHSDVCSIYLFDDQAQKLVLKATKGLNPSSSGTISMKLGEGLSGIALKEMRPICERNASKSAGYRHFEGIGEEQYESFLAVPILHGRVRIGVMVIQNAKSNYFTEEDIKALMAITTQMANTIEMAKLLMDLEIRPQQKQEQEEEKGLKLLKGKIGAGGFAIGRAAVLDSALLSPAEERTLLERPCVMRDFHQAVQAAEKQLETLQQQIEAQFSDVASMIFAAQILMLKDTAFVGAIEQLIEQGRHPAEAIRMTDEGYIRLFEKLPNAYLQERIQDVQDIGRRLMKNLAGINTQTADYTDCIIIGMELFPSDIFKLVSRRIKGIILLRGGVTSHLSILARSLGIPLIIVNEKRILNIAQGTQIILDCELGNVHIDPAEGVVRAYAQKEKDKAETGGLAAQVRESTFTKDGARVKLLSNINLLGDAAVALSMKSEGIGLYRTEFPFLVRSNFPSEEEQYIIYQKLTDMMKGKEVTFRTLDIGGDKIISYYDYGHENNPFLGMRSIRFSLRHKDLFRAQIRAILRAGAEAELKIMFPMISSLDEFLEAKAMVQTCIKDLQREKIKTHRAPKIGMMVELPSVLEIIDELAKEADFFSIGTNDFIQYMLGVDRTNERISDIYLPHHPAILRGLCKVTLAAKRHGIGLSICGDMVHDQAYVPYILGFGIRELSLDARLVPKIQSFNQGLDMGQAEDRASKILQHNTIDGVEAALKKDTKIFGSPKM